jgi:hypothetical protein
MSELTVRKIKPDETHYAGQLVPGSALWLARYIVEFDDPGYSRFYSKKKAAGVTEKSALRKARRYLKKFEDANNSHKTVTI